jgi:hypothetical protein
MSEKNKTINNNIEMVDKRAMKRLIHIVLFGM